MCVLMNNFESLEQIDVAVHIKNETDVKLKLNLVEIGNANSNVVPCVDLLWPRWPHVYLKPVLYTIPLYTHTRALYRKHLKISLQKATDMRIFNSHSSAVGVVAAATAMFEVSNWFEFFTVLYYWMNARMHKWRSWEGAPVSLRSMHKCWYIVRMWGCDTT